MFHSTERVRILVLLALLLLITLAADGMDTAFTYQGRLKDGGSPASGDFDFQFILYDAEVGGSQVGSILYGDDLYVDDGYFTVHLDFGSGIFTGDELWLEVSVRLGSSTGSYTVLSPRQPLLPAPYSLYAGEVSWLDISDMPAGFADGVDDAVPSGAVMFFDLTSCPDGWTELAGARGRAIVGLPVAGTLSGTVGSPLGNQEDRGHDHTVDPAPVTSALEPSHSHTINPFNTTPVMPAGGPLVITAIPFQSQNAGQHDHSVDVGSTLSSSATTSEVMPYIQLLACRKD